MAYRNARLEEMGSAPPTMRKTGTTICGVIFKDGVVLGADTRATEGPIVADKNCEKIHHIAANIYCCGAGTSADTEATTAMVASSVELHRLATGREPPVVVALTQLKQYLFRYQGHVSAALVLGGVDASGPSLYTVYPHGSTDRLPFVTMGSGSLAAMAIFEAGWTEGMELEAAVDLVQRAILSGIENDLGSGSNVDITVLQRGKTDIRRNALTPNERRFRRDAGYTYAKGTTAVISDSFTPFARAADSDDDQADTPPANAMQED